MELFLSVEATLLLRTTVSLAGHLAKLEVKVLNKAGRGSGELVINFAALLAFQ